MLSIGLESQPKMTDFGCLVSDEDVVPFARHLHDLSLGTDPNLTKLLHVEGHEPKR